MTNEYNHVSITRNIGLENISLDEFLDKIQSVDMMRYSMRYCHIKLNQIKLFL